MSPEQQELLRLSKFEREAAWTHAKRLPKHAGDTLAAFAIRHPIWAMGGAAALAMGIASRRSRKTGREGKMSSWPMALAAMGSQLLPDLLRLAGLTMQGRAPVPPVTAQPPESP